ncbi:MAG: FixH family protein [Gammaproteobacteria bacterium]|nr:FixH family protein [Gammaproteobacteria bacterium]
MKRIRNSTAVTVLVCFSAWAVALAGEHDHHRDQHHWMSAQGLYEVRYTSALQPIEINRIHGWVLHIETEQGDPVENAEITIDGGMPAHNHGLPTSPRVTKYLGDGNYRAEGFRFHMKGDWQIRITIAAGGKVDTAVIDMTL